MDDIGHGHGWEMAWVWLLGLIFMILFILLIIKTIGIDEPPAGREGKSAIDILNEKYASGEIDKKEYEDKKRDLK